MSYLFEKQDLSFLEEMKDVTPLKHRNDTIVNRKSRPETTLAQQLKRASLEKENSHDGNYLSVEKVTPVDPYDFLSYKKDGVQEGVFKKLRLGKYQIDATLNLQQCNFDRARSEVFETIKENHKKGIRTLLIQHGLGKNSKPFPALLKSYVNQWLPQMPEVLAFHTALRNHGGLTAVYVLLKKNSEAKLANREINRKK